VLAREVSYSVRRLPSAVHRDSRTEDDESVHITRYP
jgi:hypothetical protein